MAYASPFEKQPQPPQKPFSFEEKQLLQIKLMSRAGDTNEAHTNWVMKYMDAYRTLIESEPGLHDLFEKDEDACLEYINKHLGIEDQTYH